MKRSICRIQCGYYMPSFFLIFPFSHFPIFPFLPKSLARKTLYSMDLYMALTMFPSIAFQASLEGYSAGYPFGGTFAWTLVVIMANDSGAYPWANLEAAIVGYPVTIVCDSVLLVPVLLTQLAKIQHLPCCRQRG